MADERRDGLEQYLQNVAVDPGMLRSDVFVDFWKRAQLDTFGISPVKAALEVFLPSGRSMQVTVLTSDTAERVLEVLSREVGLCPELQDYFGLFLVGFRQDAEPSVLKKLADFELPFATLQSAEEEKCRVELRKWYLDPALDARLMDCSAARALLYTQALRDMDREWTKLTEAQRQELEALQKENNQARFLELFRGVWHYGDLQLDPCTCDFPEPGCLAELAVGSSAIRCRVSLPGDQRQEVTFTMSSLRCWEVAFPGTLLAPDGAPRALPPPELRLQCWADGCWRWFVLRTKQAFLLSSCLQKMISEKAAKLAAEDPAMQIEDPGPGKGQKCRVPQSQDLKDHSTSQSRKSKAHTASAGCVWGTLTERDL